MNKFLGSKILIVDDEYGNIFFLKRVLNSEGYATITAMNGLEALHKLEEEMPDVMLDIMMPEMTGLEVLKRLKENEITKDIPVIMISAKTEANDIKTALDLGALEYIRKPVDEIELLARLRTALRVTRSELEIRENLRTKEEFIRIVAHDLRTPFSSISGFAQLLLEDKEINKFYSDEHLEFLGFIQSSSSFMFEYFNKLLNWSKVGTDELMLEKKKTEIKPIINSILLINRFKMQSKRIACLNNVPDNLYIDIDEVYFSQVINNLISNSLKFTPSGGEVLIDYKVSGDLIHLIISDNGPGMNEDTIQHIFNDLPVKSTKGTEGEKGTGLGLKICDRIIRNHGFQMQISSLQNKGTSIHIIISKGDMN